MSTPEMQEVLDTIQEIIDATNEGEMTWSRNNPTTFVWKRRIGPGESAVASIQKTLKMKQVKSGSRMVARKVENYVFQVVNSETKSQMLSISSDELPELKEPLMRLYRVASADITKKGVEFIRKAIGRESEK